MGSLLKVQRADISFFFVPKRDLPMDRVSVHWRMWELLFMQQKISEIDNYFFINQIDLIRDPELALIPNGLSRK